VKLAKKFAVALGIIAIAILVGAAQEFLMDSFFGFHIVDTGLMLTGTVLLVRAMSPPKTVAATGEAPTRPRGAVSVELH
jgi:hydrogenase-4 membrane subunit HyfE